MTEAADLQRIADLLGGARILRHPLRTQLDAHEVLLEGLPPQALSHLLDNLAILRRATFLERVVGMSPRTFRHHRSAPATPLSREQSGRIWRFARILAKAAAVFGSQEEAERWLERPVLGLNQHRPIDLLVTPAGFEAVCDFLQRLECGGYT